MEERSKVLVYKCPSCGGALRYDAKAGRLACMWCGNTFESDVRESKQVSTDLLGYLCPECGAQLMTDDFVVADTCPYCGNNEIAAHRFEGSFKPDLVIPFSVTKQQAIDCYDKVVAEKKYLPDDFVANARVISVLGTYVPFWLQGGVVDFDFTYIGYQKKDKVSYEYHLHRVGTYDFQRVPADGSERMPDDVMDSIEPYDYNALVPFSTEYIPGFMAERYTVDQEEVGRRVRRRAANSACQAALETVGKEYKPRYPDYDRYNAVVDCSHIEQAILPVWLLAVSYGGNKYVVGVNGQTGKVAANFPVDEKKKQTAAAREALNNAGKVLLAELVFFAFVYGIGVSAVGVGGMSERIGSILSGSAFADGNVANIFMFVIYVALLLALIVGPALFAYRSAKKRVLESMQNVKVATDANDYDIGGLNLTLSDFGEGPLNKG